MIEIDGLSRKFGEVTAEVALRLSVAAARRQRTLLGPPP